MSELSVYREITDKAVLIKDPQKCEPTEKGVSVVLGI
jgi:hypothetical protein